MHSVACKQGGGEEEGEGRNIRIVVAVVLGGARRGEAAAFCCCSVLQFLSCPSLLPAEARMGITPAPAGEGRGAATSRNKAHWWKGKVGSPCVSKI